MNIESSDTGERSVPGICHYCHQAIEGGHRFDCVCLRRSVVIQMTVEYVVSEVRAANPAGIEFHRNDGSWCAANDFKSLVEASSPPNSGHCGCGQARFKFIREATQEDHNKMLVCISEDD